MNFFWVKDGNLYTPKLNGQILHGVTRKSIIEIARSLGMQVFEQDLLLTDLLAGHDDGSITEVFASGTAAVITPLGEIGVENSDLSITQLTFKDSPVAWKLRDILVQTHLGKTAFSDQWLDKIQLD